MGLRAGLLDRVATIERATVTLNALNEEVETWATHTKIRCRVRYLKGSEMLKMEREVLATTIEIETHYLPGILTTDRISYDSKYWNIRYIEEIGRRMALKITAEVDHAS